MNVKTLDGHSVKWSLSGSISKISNIDHKSSLHVSARKLLTDMFPTLQLLEEVSAPVRRSETLFLDFYIPLKKICIETHGEQHYKMVGFYHQNLMGFLRSKKRDSDKKEWCSLNGISYVDLPYNEDIEQWRERISNA